MLLLDVTTQEVSTGPDWGLISLLIITFLSTTFLTVIIETAKAFGWSILSGIFAGLVLVITIHLGLGLVSTGLAYLSLNGIDAGGTLGLLSIVFVIGVLLFGFGVTFVARSRSAVGAGAMAVGLIIILVLGLRYLHTAFPIG